MHIKEKKTPSKRTSLYARKAITLDAEHTNKLTDFTNYEEYEATLLNRLESLKKKLHSVSSQEESASISQELELKAEIRKVEKEIRDSRAVNNEVDYFTNTSHILFRYYEVVDKQCDNPVEKKSILDFFSTNKSTSKSDIDPPPAQDVMHSRDRDRDRDQSTDTAKDDSHPYVSMSMSGGDNRAKLLDRYLSCTDVNYINENVKHVPIDVCTYCNDSNRKVYVHEGIVCCDNCNSIEYVITDNEKPSYKEPPKEVSYYCYARINHLQEWLNHIQGKETTNIPDEVFDDILLEIKKQRINNVASLTPKKIREILKKLKINKYYEHIPYILNRITGIPNPHLTPEIEEQLKNMFKEMQVPYLKHSPAKRKNFLSYSYTLYKLLQLMGQTQYLKYFPLLKSREKLHQQEQIWQKICNDLGWTFIRSI